MVQVNTKKQHYFTNIRINKTINKKLKATQKYHLQYLKLLAKP